MPPTLASLLRNPALKLAVLAGGDRLAEAAVRWVHTSELDDPTPYLEGGELLLTTGLKLDVGSAEALGQYVARLAGAGVVALGFGVGVSHDTVPQALVDAAAAHRLPLLEVPHRTPFIAISKAVSAEIAADRYKTVTAGFEAQRELTRAALAPDGTTALLSRLAAHLKGWAALYDASGAVVAAAPEWAGRRAARLAGEVERLRGRSAPASAAMAGTEDRVEVHSLGTGRRPRGFLAVGTEERPDTSARYLVNAAVALLTLSLEQSRALQDTEQRLGAALLRMLLVGEPEHARTVAGRLYGGLLDAPVRVLVAERAAGVAGDAVGLLAERVETAALRAAEPVLVVRDAGRLTALAAAEGEVARACLAVVDGSDDLVAGVSAAADAAGVPGAHEQAQRALAVARRRGRSVVEHDEVGSGSMLGLLGDDAVRAFADGLLRPLREHDATARGDLVASLRAWLSRHGQWDAAAADLGVHRHTLRYRMRRVEEILERSLDDPDVRMELWLALKTRG
ncbi:PucR family transcriptional regulator [Actinacidiphila sp. bgisy167]|uniref:PucR family transcriptional regulator n=1 Tax=Actinacidiphila sp. bgisy167 TaxID=3413797 RepID=UPI003D74AAA9